LPCVFGGDFNNSVIWDKPNNQNNFENINLKLKGLGFHSAYHSNTNDGFGSEETPTFFHTKQESKKYHIDYLYLKSLESNLVELGDYDDWIKLSDHVPIMVECINS
jgi:endonuclease/exonuclease/phosphatase family metal-dependent hydrolase